MKKTTLLKSMLLLCALVVGSGSLWAGTVTRTENFASSKAASNAYSSGSQATTSGMQDDWDYAWTPANSVYVFQSGIRLGKSSGTPNTGTVTNTTMLSGISTGTSVTIKVYAAQWNNDGGSLVVTYNGSSDTKAPSNSKITDTSAEYSSSDFSSSTNFTITKAADVTSFSIASSTKRIIIDKVEVVYDDGPAKAANDLAWSAASKSVTYSETPYGLPTLTNPHSLAIEYTSTDESVATIDSEGNVTIKNKTGNTTISAHTDGDATYAAGTVSYTLNVTRKVILEDGVFDFSFGEDYGSGVTQNGSLIEGSTSTWTSTNIVMTIANRYAWHSDGNLRAYKATSSYDASVITISCPAGNAITQIEFTGPYTGTGALSNIAANTGTYAVTSTSAIWTGAAQSVIFTASNSTYINTITVTYGSSVPVKTNADRNYGTMVTPTGIKLNFAAVADDAKAYISTGLNGAKNKVMIKSIDVVPASTPIILYTTTQGATVNVPITTDAASDVLASKLVAGDGTTAWNGTAGYTYFYLASDEFHEATSGTLKSGKAYLKILTSDLSGHDLSFGFEEGESEGDVTGISEVSTKKEFNGNIFNLAGQRVDANHKGIVIVNGKKFFNK